ncbi:MAG: RNA-binding cell elongation regulator Jag/EloR [Peptococcaceae bacterium]|nr:RNA-binding cell elongation regulator Jag/EloR [Peptococcaceae bacterium]
MIEKMKITAKTVDEAIKKAADIWKIDAVKNGYTVIQEPSRGIFGLGSKDAIIEVNKTLPDLAEEKPVAKPQAAPEKKAPAKEAAPETELLIKEVTVEEMPAPAPQKEEEARTEIIVEDISQLNAEEALAHVEGETAEDIGLSFLGPILDALDVDAVVHVTETDDSIRFDVSGEDVGILIGRHGETLNAIQFLMSLVINGRLESRKGVIFDVENYRARQRDKLEALALRMAEKCRKTHRRVVLNPMNAAERRIIHITLEKEAGVSSYSEGNEPNRRVVIVAD